VTVAGVAAQREARGDAHQYHQPGAQRQAVVLLHLKQNGAGHVQKDADDEAADDHVDVGVGRNQQPGRRAHRGSHGERSHGQGSALRIDALMLKPVRHEGCDGQVIRADFAKGKTPETISPTVLNYIRDRGLYGSR